MRQARERRIPVKTCTIPMHDVDRAIADNETTGFVRIHVKDRTDRILGATIVARQRSRGADSTGEAARGDPHRRCNDRHPPETNNG